MMMMRLFSKLAPATGLAVVAIAAIQMLSATAASAEDMYGAIATDEDGQWGYTYNSPTRAQAEASSLKECGKDDCVVRVWFKNACGAVAENNKVIGWGWSADAAEAKAQAISSCGSGDCKITTWACTDR
jgi:serine/threonine-protein kinase